VEAYVRAPVLDPEAKTHLEATYFELCIGAARGLQYLHELHIIHGAVKRRRTLIMMDEE
jgi:hypothetical protein